MNRKSYDKKFKSKLALEAIRGEQTIQEIASKYDVHPNQIQKWKKQLLENAEDLFERPNKKNSDLTDSELKESELYKSIGKLQVENQFLKKKVQGTVRSRAEAIEPDHKDLSIAEQCNLMGISRSRR